MPALLDRHADLELHLLDDPLAEGGDVGLLDPVERGQLVEDQRLDALRLGGAWAAPFWASAAATSSSDEARGQGGGFLREESWRASGSWVDRGRDRSRGSTVSRIDRVARRDRRLVLARHARARDRLDVIAGTASGTGRSRRRRGRRRGAGRRPAGPRRSRPGRGPRPRAAASWLLRQEVLADLVGEPDGHLDDVLALDQSRPSRRSAGRSRGSGARGRSP